MGFKLEIIGNEKIGEALESLCNLKKEVLSKAGFEVYYTKEDGKYYFYCVTKTISATIGMKLGGKKAIIKEMKKWKELDPNLEIKEVEFK